jgi:hypothetical protein
MFSADKPGQIGRASDGVSRDNLKAAFNDASNCASCRTANESEVTKSVQSKPAVYQIRISGHLDDKWTGYFEGLSVDLEECGDTVLTGPVIDQAMLHGLFKKIRNLGLVLISVNVADKP